jgi:hypothetical protein
MPKALVESFGSQIEFRDKLAKQLEIKLRSLVAGETTGETEDGKATRSSDITLEFCDGQTGQTLGTELSLSATYLNVSGLEDVPDYAPSSRDEQSSSSNNVRTYLLSRQNRDYYREYVDYFVKTAMLKSAGFALTNNGVLGARDVYIDLRISSTIPDLTIGTNTKLKVVKPETDKDSSFSISFDDAFSGIAGDSLQVEKSSEGWAASVEARALQPKRVVKSRHKMVIGAKVSGKILIDAKIFADILPEPVTQRLEIAISVNVVEVPAMELLKQNEILLSDSSQGTRRRRTVLREPLDDPSDSADPA